MTRRGMSWSGRMWLGGSVVAVVAALAFWGCGGDDDDGNTPDGSTGTADAGAADAGVADSGPGAEKTHSGTVAVHEIALLDAPGAGKGGQIDITFSPNGTPSAASFSTDQAIPPCSATLTDVDVAAQNPPDTDQGAVSFTITQMGGAPGSVVPACTFQAASGGYQCISAMGTGGTVTVGAGTTWTFANTTEDPPEFSASLVGQYLVGVGKAEGAFPIVGASGSQLGLFTQEVAGPPAVFGSWVIVAGVGPVPYSAAPDGSGVGAAPEFFADTDRIGATLAGGPNIAAATVPDIAVGAAFELSAETTTLLEDGIDVLGTPADVTLACEDPCPAAAGTIVNIVTSDATSFPGGLTDMGTPERFVASATCAAFDDQVTLPAGLIDILRMARPTKMRISIFRDGFAPVAGTAPMGDTNVVAGHGLVKFQLVDQLPK